MILKFKLPRFPHHEDLDFAESVTNTLNARFDIHNMEDAVARNVRIFKGGGDYEYKIFIETSNNSAQFVANIGYEVGDVINTILNY